MRPKVNKIFPEEKIKKLTEKYHLNCTTERYRYGIKSLKVFPPNSVIATSSTLPMFTWFNNVNVLSVYTGITLLSNDKRVSLSYCADVIVNNMKELEEQVKSFVTLFELAKKLQKEYSIEIKKSSIEKDFDNVNKN